MKNILLTLLVTAAAFFGAMAFQPSTVAALDCSNPQTAKEQIQCGACEASGTTDAKGNPTCDPSTSAGGVDSTIATVLNILSSVAGIAAVIMIIVAGLRYVTSGGKEEAVKSAKNTLVYVVIGLIIIVLAQIIVHFVLNQATNASTDCVNGKIASGANKGDKCSG